MENAPLMSLMLMVYTEAMLMGSTWLYDVPIGREAWTRGLVVHFHERWRKEGDGTDR